MVPRKTTAWLDERWTLPAVLALLAASVVWWFLAWHVPGDRERARDRWRERLTAMAEDRVFALDRWLSAGMADARRLAADPELWELAPASRLPPAAVERAATRLDLLTPAEYGSATLVLASGAPAARIERRPGIGSAELAAASSEALTRGSAVVGLWRSRRGVLAVLFAAPLPDPDGREPLAALVLEDDPDDFLFPLLAREPAPTETGETLLARSEGREALFLAPMRSGDRGPLEHRTPLATPGFAMAAALAGQQTFGTFVDYHGVEVLAVTRRLKSVPWGLVVKVDAAEAMALHRSHIRERSIWGLLFLSLLAALLAALGKLRESGHEARLARLNRLYRTLSAVNQLIVHGADRDGLYQGVPRILARTGGFRLAWLGLTRPGGALEIVGSSGEGEAYLEGIEVRWDDTPQGHGPAGTSIRTGRPVVLDDVEDHASFGPWQERAARHGLRGCAAFPVFVEGQARGALMVYTPAPGALGAEECELVEELARDLGFALGSLAAVETHRSLEARLRAVFESGVIGVLFGDVDGRVLDANQAFLDLIGYSREELERGAIRWDAITPPEHLPRDLEGVAEARARGACTPYEKEYIRKDGTRIWVVVGYTLLEPERERSAAFILDISERKRAESALRESEARTRAIVETAVDGIVTIDERGRIESFNPAAERMFGYAAAEVLGRNVSMLMPAPHSEEHDAHLARYLSTGEARIIGVGREVPGRRKDGSELAIELAVAEFRVGDRRAFAGLLHDLSERKRFEEQLQRSQRVEAIGLLAGGVAHDFNNLLGVITGYSELAQRGLEAEHPGRRQIGEVLKAAERAAGLTQQLLAFSRRQVLSPKIVGLNDLLADLEQMLRRLIGEDVELLVRPDPAIGAVRVDPGQMEQVVLNLALNARDAMPRGGRLTLSTAEVQSQVVRSGADWGVDPGPYVRLSVEDTGKGMDEATQARLFEPFFTTKPLGQGTGLGLATVYGIVEQSGGHVLVESAPGKGARFDVYLPRVEGMPEDAPEALDEAIRGDETILIVEDQEELRAVTQEALADLGYRLLSARDAETAMALARAHQGEVDLLLSDVVMPGLSGPELAERFLAIWPDTPVLLMSGYTSDVLQRHDALGERFDLIEKPFTQRQLARSVREVLDRRDPARSGAGVRRKGDPGPGAG